MKRFIRGAMMMVMFFFFMDAYAKSNTIYIGQPEPRYEIRRLFLKIAVSIQLEGNYPDYTILPAQFKNLTQARLFKLLEFKRGIDVVFLAYTPERARRARMIPIPILQGTIGYRVFIIDKKYKQKFSRITLKELKALRAGAGVHWGDTSILEENGFNVVKPLEKSNLFNMLIRDRIDYFPRSFIEAPVEVEQLNQIVGEERFIIEETKAFFYEFPIYYYVHKENEQLAKRIEAGFKKAQRLGIIKTRFRKYYDKELREANFENKIVFRLPNTHFPPGFESSIDTSEWLPKRK